MPDLWNIEIYYSKLLKGLRPQATGIDITSAILSGYTVIPLYPHTIVPFIYRFWS